jgi:hypothetical protein
VSVNVSNPVAPQQTYTLHVQDGQTDPGTGDYRLDATLGDSYSISSNGQGAPEFTLTDNESELGVPGKTVTFTIINDGDALVSFSMTNAKALTKTATTDTQGVAKAQVYARSNTGTSTLVGSYPDIDSKMIKLLVV